MKALKSFNEDSTSRIKQNNSLYNCGLSRIERTTSGMLYIANNLQDLCLQHLTSIETEIAVEWG
jgi:hypothetical protein